MVTPKIVRYILQFFMAMVNPFPTEFGIYHRTDFREKFLAFFTKAASGMIKFYCKVVFEPLICCEKPDTISPVVTIT